MHRQKSSGLPITDKHCVHTGTRCPLLCPSTRSQPCPQAPAPCLNSRVGTWKKGVFTLVPSEYHTQAPSVNTEIDSQYYNEIVHSISKQTWLTLAPWVLIHFAILHVKMTIYRQKCDTYVVV